MNPIHHLDTHFHSQNVEQSVLGRIEVDRSDQIRIEMRSTRSTNWMLQYLRNVGSVATRARVLTRKNQHFRQIVAEESII